MLRRGSCYYLCAMLRREAGRLAGKQQGQWGFWGWPENEGTRGEETKKCWWWWPLVRPLSAPLSLRPAQEAAPDMR